MVLLYFRSLVSSKNKFVDRCLQMSRILTTPFPHLLQFLNLKIVLVQLSFSARLIFHTRQFQVYHTIPYHTIPYHTYYLYFLHCNEIGQIISIWIWWFFCSCRKVNIYISVGALENNWKEHNRWFQIIVRSILLLVGVIKICAGRHPLNVILLIPLSSK